MSDCSNLKPKFCGGRLIPFLSDKGCGIPRFIGIEDVTINQGIGIDLTEGVYAYDGNGNEIEYTVTPDSIDMCDVGEHTVIYRAMAEGKKFAPWFCSKQRGLAGDLLCNRVALRKDRTVTIEQIDPPRIEGLDTVKISPNVEFDPTEGVTAIDGNGNEIEYTYSGLADAVAEGAIASFDTEFEQNARSVVADIEPIQSGSGTPSPDNVRPISGHTECVTSVRGENLIPTPYYSGVSYTTNGITFIANNDGSVTIKAGTASGMAYYMFNTSSNRKPIGRGTQAYTISAEGVALNPSGINLQADLYADGVYVGTAQGTHETQTISGNNLEIGTVRIGVKTGYVISSDIVIKPQLELGSTASDYESFNGTTHTTTLGRTVYGGTLDVVSGVLTVDRVTLTFDGTESGTWGIYGQGEPHQCFNRSISDKKTGWQTSICNQFPNVNYAFSNSEYGIYCDHPSNDTVYFRQPNADVVTVADWRQWLSQNPVQIVYELATPQTYQLTPTEIAILQGQNNIWCDTGEVRVVYQESMPVDESIEYETIGERIITYTATDVCGNTTEVERQILVGITAQACKSQACGAFVYCASAEACEAIVGLSATACE